MGREGHPLTQVVLTRGTTRNGSPTSKPDQRDARSTGAGAAREIRARTAWPPPDRQPAGGAPRPPEVCHAGDARIRRPDLFSDGTQEALPVESSRLREARA